MALGLACSVRFRNCGVRVRVRVRDARARATTTTRAVSAAPARKTDPRAPVRADEVEAVVVEADGDSDDDARANETVERIALAYEIVVPSYEGDAREAVVARVPALGVATIPQCRRGERAMSDILRCDVVADDDDDDDRVVVVRQTSKWRHNALIGGNR